MTLCISIDSETQCHLEIERGAISNGHGDGLGATGVEDMMKRDAEVKKAEIENQPDPVEEEPTQAEQIMGTSLDVLQQNLQKMVRLVQTCI